MRRRALHFSRMADDSVVKAGLKPERPASEQLYLLSYPWDNSPIKVGRAHDVSARMCQLEGGHNFRLKLLADYWDYAWPFDNQAGAVFAAAAE